MYLIALKMLFGDRKKYLSMVVGIVFASLIMSLYPGVYEGIMSRSYAMIDDAGVGDIWVMNKGVQHLDENKPMRTTDLDLVRGVEGVEWASPIIKSLLPIKLPDGTLKMLDIIGVDDSTMVGLPKKLIGGGMLDLKREDAVFFDRAAAHSLLNYKAKNKELQPLEIGDMIEINKHRAYVAGYVKATRSIVYKPKAYSTYNRVLSMSPINDRYLSFIIVKAKKGVNHKKLAADIKAKTNLLAYTANEFRQVNRDYWFESTGIAVNIGIGVILGFLVGVSIVGQTFFNFITENIKQYATFMAMGLKIETLVKMVYLQSLIIGMIGYGIGIGLTTIFGIMVNDTVVAFKMPFKLLLFSGGGVFIIILLSARLAIRQVIKVDPSIVFRGQ
jgi:putative ABC transport system permease protein